MFLKHLFFVLLVQSLMTECSYVQHSAYAPRAVSEARKRTYETEHLLFFKFDLTFGRRSNDFLYSIVIFRVSATATGSSSSALYFTRNKTEIDVSYQLFIAHTKPSPPDLRPAPSFLISDPYRVSDPRSTSPAKRRCDDRPETIRPTEIVEPLNLFTRPLNQNIMFI